MGGPREVGALSNSSAHRATLLYIYSVGSKIALSLPKNVCTSYYITCRRFRVFYGESMGKYGQFYGQKPCVIV